VNGDRQTYVKRILKAIENGTLLPDETERRLCALIEEEVTRTDAQPDEEYISACIALWEELHGKTDAEYEARAARLRLRIDDAIRAREKHGKLRGWGFKALIATAAMIVLLVGIGIPLRWVWFENWSTPDEQQHVIMGHEITVDMVEKAMAENAHIGSVTVEHPSELAEYLGFDPGIPATLGQAWRVDRSTIRYFSGYIRVSTMYQHQDDSSRRLTCTIHFYTDIEFAYFSFEQSREGDAVCIDGKEIYVSINNKRKSASWYDNAMFIHVSGDEDNIVQILCELIGVKYDEEN
jgi:hypothetical protein